MVDMHREIHVTPEESKDSPPKLVSMITYDELQNYRGRVGNIRLSYVRFVVDMNDTSQIAVGGNLHTETAGLFSGDNLTLWGGTIELGNDFHGVDIKFGAKINERKENKGPYEIQDERLREAIKEIVTSKITP